MIRTPSSSQLICYYWIYLGVCSTASHFFFTTKGPPYIIFLLQSYPNYFNLNNTLLSYDLFTILHIKYWIVHIRIKLFNQKRLRFIFSHWNYQRIWNYYMLQMIYIIPIKLISISYFTYWHLNKTWMTEYSSERPYRVSPYYTLCNIYSNFGCLVYVS